MKAIPSIAFSEFRGSAKGVTARIVNGRQVLSSRALQPRNATAAQLACRASFAKIAKEYRRLASRQMEDWETLAEKLKGVSVFGEHASLTAHNAFVRLNSNRVMAGEMILFDAPAYSEIPAVRYSRVWLTDEMTLITGIEPENPDYKLVVKMSQAQSPGVVSGWSKTVVVAPGVYDDWGDAELSEEYNRTIGFPVKTGDKVFVEMYWLDSKTGFTGPVEQTSAICVSKAAAVSEGYVERSRYTMENLDMSKENNVSALDMEFSTGAPVAAISAVLDTVEGGSWSRVYFTEPLPFKKSVYNGTRWNPPQAAGFFLARTCNGTRINAQCRYAQLHMGDLTSLGYMGGRYQYPSEAFGVMVVAAYEK